MSDHEQQHKAAQKAEQAILRWLRGDVDHVQCVTTRNGHRHVMEWTHAPNTTLNANE
jgi:hypothetical protein